MKVKTENLTGAALDWVVATLQNVEIDEQNKPIWFGDEDSFSPRVEYKPSTEWPIGGPLMEREGLTIAHQNDRWAAQTDDDVFAYGPTMLIAAMRCYVASKMGDEVDLPDELVEIGPTPCMPVTHVDSQCLTGHALNWVVARCVDQPVFWHAQDRALYMGDGPGGDLEYNPETNWEQGGPLINHYRIDSSWDEGTLTWSAFTDSYMARGSTALQAAMRALVTSHHGDTVVVPTELLQDAQVIGLDKDGNTIFWNAQTAQPYNSGAPH